MALSHSPRSDCEKRNRKNQSDQSQSVHLVYGSSSGIKQFLTGIYSGSHSGMFRLLISMAIFLRWPGLVTPMAVRSCRYNKTQDMIYSVKPHRGSQ